MVVTRHAKTRMQQRAISDESANLIVMFGTEVADGYLLRHKDVALAANDDGALRNKLERIRGGRAVVQDGALVTVYHASRSKQHRLLSGRRR